MHAGDRQWGLAMQDDVTDGVKWLVSEGIADPNRIGIVGGSYGGYAALMGAVKTPELYRCAVSLNGVSDLINLLTTDTGNFRDEEIARMIGDTRADYDMLVANSPMRQVARIGIPVLLVHARDDARVDFAESERMFDALRKAGKSADLIALDSGEHYLLNEAARAKFLAVLETFLERNMAPR
jgi:dipeptidyl aminopeptidase/acylaminoacyl peptidase